MSLTPTRARRQVDERDQRSFAVQVHADGRLGLLDEGTADDVPERLRELAAAAWDAGVAECSFYWTSPDTPSFLRVGIHRQREGGLEVALLRGIPVTHLPHGLTARELQVLTLLSAGLGNAELAAEISVSRRTATTHVDRVLQKLGTSTRTAAAAYALDAGLLHAPLPGSIDAYAHLSLGRLLATAATPAPRQPRPAAAPAPPRRRALVIGAVVPLHGVGSEDGREMLNGLTLAVEEINAAGGVRGRSLRTEVHDVDVTSEASVRTAFAQVLAGRADVLTSGYLAAQEISLEAAADSGVPYLHAATSGVMERAVRDDPGRFGRVFQVCPSDTGYAPRFVSYLTSARDQGLLATASRRLVVLRQDWTHLSFGAEEAAATATAAGWELECHRVGGSPGDDSWARAVADVLRAPAAAIMIGSYLVGDAVQAVSALRASGSQALAYAVYAPSVPAFRRRLGATAEGVLWSTTAGTYSDRLGISFAQRYARRFGGAPGRSHAGLAYDRAHRVALAWQLVDDPGDPDLLVAELRSRPYRGVNGTYNFDTPGQAARGFDGDAGDPSMAQPQLIYQVQDGQQVIIDGGPFRTGRFRRHVGS